MHITWAIRSLTIARWLTLDSVANDLDANRVRVWVGVIKKIGAMALVLGEMNMFLFPAFDVLVWNAPCSF